MTSGRTIFQLCAWREENAASYIPEGEHVLMTSKACATERDERSQWIYRPGDNAGSTWSPFSPINLGSTSFTTRHTGFKSERVEKIVAARAHRNRADPVNSA